MKVAEIFQVVFVRLLLNFASFLPVNDIKRTTRMWRCGS